MNQNAPDRTDRQKPAVTNPVDAGGATPNAKEQRLNRIAAREALIAKRQARENQTAEPLAKNPTVDAPQQNVPAPEADTPKVPSPVAQPPVAKPAQAAVAPATPPAKPAQAVVAPSMPPARPARMRGRHWGIIVSFLVYVCLPSAFVGWYLWERAADQYASTVGFSVRTENTSSAIELLGGITELSGSSSSDTDVLYEFIQSQRMVSDIDADIDLRAMWSKPENDPYFAFDPDGTIEDLLDHWSRMIRISYDSGTKLIEVRALAFDPQDAQDIANAIYEESQAMINQLSDISRADSIVFAEQELNEAVEQLKVARTAVTAFRNRTQIVDPTQSVTTQTTLIGNLEGQLATALIDLDLLLLTAREQDPRTVQARLRVQVIEERISEERRKLGFGEGGEDDDAFASLVGEFERLQVDREFAEKAYTSALVSYETALADARRQTRYLAAHVLPTMAERSRFPQREVLLALFALFNFLVWSISLLLIYALKDRR